MEQSVGWGVREWRGCCRDGVNKLIGSFTGGLEVGEVKRTEFQVGAYGLEIQVAEACHIFRVVPLNGGIERGGEEPDRVVGGRWRKIDGGRDWISGRTSITVVYGASRLQTWLDGVQQIKQS